MFLLGCAGGGGGSSRGANVVGPLSTINLVNNTAAAGVTMAQVVVPVEKGRFQDAPVVRTEFNAACSCFPMGARYDDGSLRYLRLEVPVDVLPNDRQSLHLSATDESTPPQFQKHGKISGQAGIQATFRAQGFETSFDAYEVIEEGPATRVLRARGGFAKSMIWVELTITLYSGLPHAKFTLQWGNSNPNFPELFVDPGPVELVIRGAQVEFEFEKAKVLSRTDDAGTMTARLHESGDIADGQAQMLEGRLVWGGGSPPRVFAIATEWVDLGTYGPFGELLPQVKVDPREFAALIDYETNKHIDDPWAWPVHGCNPEPSSTGGQADFGTITMRPDIVLADPSRLQTITRSVYQEACRATHFREADRTPVRASGHPNLLTLGGRPKDEFSYSDLLGKQPGWLTGMMRAPGGQKWLGHDTEHLSINFLAGLALLTGNRYAREEVDWHCELYLTGFTYKSGSWNDTPGPARKVGRSALAACWMWLVTGREDVRERVMNRARNVLGTMQAANTKVPVVAPRGAEYNPWEEGNAVAGMAAVFHNFGSLEALQVAVLVSQTVTMHTFGKLTDGTWRIAYRAPFDDGKGNPYVALLDPSFDSKAAGGGLTTWAITGVAFAAEAHPDPAVRAKGEEILRGLYAGPMNGLDDALRWLPLSPKVLDLTGMTSMQ
ncbi:MAG: hypothetical protein KDC87_07995 [Planctomycetes bacterium]|nr:hypothetical protein [Planctomycetota bacterium]MCB9871051.1 hypothetical protein [Planctomycetota bacterium]